jgi:hypothetical protein
MSLFSNNTTNWESGPFPYGSTNQEIMGIDPNF